MGAAKFGNNSQLSRQPWCSSKPFWTHVFFLKMQFLAAAVWVQGTQGRGVRPLVKMVQVCFIHMMSSNATSVFLYSFILCTLLNQHILLELKENNTFSYISTYFKDFLWWQWHPFYWTSCPLSFSHGWIPKFVVPPLRKVYIWLPSNHLSVKCLEKSLRRSKRMSRFIRRSLWVQLFEFAAIGIQKFVSLLPGTA